jgi:imidazolonepropionase-like amidohydrolase
MERARLSPPQVLRAATLENARLFGLAASVETVQVGRRADLLILDADPLASAVAFDTIHSVILDGRLIDRSSLVSDVRL